MLCDGSAVNKACALPLLGAGCGGCDVKSILPCLVLGGGGFRLASTWGADELRRASSASGASNSADVRGLSSGKLGTGSNSDRCDVDAVSAFELLSLMTGFGSTVLAYEVSATFLPFRPVRSICLKASTSITTLVGGVSVVKASVFGETVLF